MSNDKELQNEIEDIHKQLEGNLNKDMLPVLQEYKSALNDVRKQLGIIYSKYSQDGKLDVQVTQEYNILKNMDLKLKYMGSKLAAIDNNKVTEILNDKYTQSYFKTAQTIQKGIDTVIDFKLVRPEMIESAVKTPMNGSMYSSRIWDNKTKLINNLRDNLKEGIEQGYDITKLSKSISNTMGSSAYDSMRLVNTETARVVNSAQQKIYTESGVVKQVMWSSTLEDSTCQDCSVLDGQYFNLEDAPDLPVHPNCRCCLIPVIEGWNPTERYNQEDGSVMNYKTYDEWSKNEK